MRDIRHALRVFRQSPAFALAAVAALTLGIGANTAVFSVVNAVLLQPVAVPEPDRLVLFMNTSEGGSNPAASPAKFMHWRAQDDVVRQPAAFRTGIISFTGGELPEQLRHGQVTTGFFSLFGAPMTLGRTFTDEEDRPGAPRVAVLSRLFWESRYGSDPDVVGRAVSLAGQPHTIVGVLDDFPFEEFGPAPQVWTPFQLDPNTTDQGHYFTSAARLQPGVTLDQAQARVATSAEAFRARFPDALQAGNGFSVQPIRDVLVQNVRPQLLVLAAAVSFVLLIACANVANLLLARATGRTREIAIRAAIGGSRARIIRQLLTESLVLSGIGGALGLLVGTLGIRALLAVNTAGLPRVGEAGALVGVDWRVVAFTVAAAVVTGLLFGLIPALQGSRSDLTSALKEGGGRSGTGLRQNYLRSVLVVVEVALAVILLVGSALLIRTSVALASVDPGFDASNVLTMRTSLTGPRYESSAGVAQAVREGVDALEALPGVEMASATCCVPLEGGYGLPFVIQGRPLEQGPFHGGGAWVTVSPGYFEVFRIALERGRLFDARDDVGGLPVVIINEAMARQYWPDGDPLNERLVIGRGVMREFADEPERQIVGVVADTRDGGLNADPGPRMYVPQPQLPDLANALNVGLTPMAWVVRTRGEPDAMSETVRDALGRATGLAVANVRSMSEVVSRSTSRQHFNMWLMSIFGGVALLLAAIGIYGLMAYTVAQRRQEIGIRLALGAQLGAVRRMIVVQGMVLAIVGVAVGVGVAFWLARYVETLVFGVGVRDRLVFVAVPVVLTFVAFIAVLIPAFRASRVDPVSALRAEA
jgi:predicted permease